MHHILILFQLGGWYQDVYIYIQIQTGVVHWVKMGVLFFVLQPLDCSSSNKGFHQVKNLILAMIIIIIRIYAMLWLTYENEVASAGKIIELSNYLVFFFFNLHFFFLFLMINLKIQIVLLYINTAVYHDTNISSVYNLSKKNK